MAMTNDPVETGKQLAELSTNSSDIVTGWLGFLASFNDNPMPALMLATLGLAVAVAWLTSKATRDVGSSAKDATGAVIHLASGGQNMLKDSIDKFHDMHERSIIASEKNAEATDKLICSLDDVCNKLEGLEKTVNSNACRYGSDCGRSERVELRKHN